LACVHVSCGARCPGLRTLSVSRSSPVFARSRSSPMSGAAGGVSHDSVVSVVGNVPSCVPGGRDASREDLQIVVDDAGLYVVLIKQLLHCVLIKQLLIARAVSKRVPIKPWRATQVKILRMCLASLAASSILHVDLMWSLLRSRVMCGIRDSTHTHMHTHKIHTHTHTCTHTHTHTHKYIHTPTPGPTPVARSCVCVEMNSLSLKQSLSLSLWVCQQHHNCGLLLDRTGQGSCWVCGMHCWHTRALVLSAAFLRGNGVTRRTQKAIQGGDNGHVGRPC
jgi:hypothetical protein